MLLMIALAAALPLADDGYTRCMDAATTNPAFAACGDALLARRDAELNRVWKSKYAELEAPAKAALLAEQRLWVAFKDKSCAYWATGDYGREGQTIHFFTCRAAIIDERIKYLGDVGNDLAE